MITTALRPTLCTDTAAVDTEDLDALTSADHYYLATVLPTGIRTPERGPDVRDAAQLLTVAAVARTRAKHLWATASPLAAAKAASYADTLDAHLTGDGPLHCGQCAQVITDDQLRAFVPQLGWVLHAVQTHCTTPTANVVAAR